MKNRKYDKATLDNLLYRRQFIFGPHYIDQFKNWREIRIADTMCLTVHPDLELYKTNYGNKSVTLLGYILDPKEPQATNYDIISSLIVKLHNSETFFKHTNDYGGRWILIVEDGEHITLFNDAMGLRQVFYTDVSCSRDLWCASQPGLIAEILSLEMDEDAVNGFMNSEVYKTWNECFWPGDSSPYKGIKHLLPNHYINLSTGLCYRYWPDRNIDNISLEEGSEVTCNLLKGLMKSASNRFDLGFGITSGWDSRLLLAASRVVSKKIYFFSLPRKPNDPDVVVPSRLLPRLRLKHNVIRYPNGMDPEFETIYKRNVATAHDLWGEMAQGLYNCYPQNRVCIKGNASEIARVRFRLQEEGVVTAKDLANFSSFNHGHLMREIAYVLTAWERWLSGVGKLYNIHILDLFYWEHWAGNFAAMAQAEWDIVQEVFTPYNCRSLITNMLSVDEEFRDHDEPILYRHSINALWPEVLNEPINPKRKLSIKERIGRKTKRIKRPIKQIIKDIEFKTAHNQG